ncbi:TLDc domain-containing protein [Entamoeba marina]
MSVDLQCGNFESLNKSVVHGFQFLCYLQSVMEQEKFQELLKRISRVECVIFNGNERAMLSKAANVSESGTSESSTNTIFKTPSAKSIDVKSPIKNQSIPREADFSEPLHGDFSGNFPMELIKFVGKSQAIIFDSDNDVDCSKKILNKENLSFYFIDDKDNVFGGHVNSRIHGLQTFISDPHCYLFSLLYRDEHKKIKPKMVKYPILQNCKDKAFQLNESSNNNVYIFGGLNDLMIILNSDNCYCQQNCFDYKSDERAISLLSSNLTKRYFKVKRIIITKHPDYRFE